MTWWLWSTSHQQWVLSETIPEQHRGTLSNAFSRLTKAKKRGLFLSMNLSWTWQSTKIASVVPFPDINPNCMEPMSTLSLSKFSITLSKTFNACSMSFRPLGISRTIINNMCTHFDINDKTSDNHYLISIFSKYVEYIYSIPTLNGIFKLVFRIVKSHREFLGIVKSHLELGVFSGNCKLQNYRDIVKWLIKVR